MLKKILIPVLLSCFCVFALAGDGRFEKKALARGLFGNVRVRQAYNSIPVRVVTSGEDLRVRIVKSGANKTGLWRFVDSGEDFLIHFEPNNGTCLSVRFVQSGEGVSIR